MLPTEREMRTLYIKYLIAIYEIEVEQEMDMGDYPSYEDWLIWYREEADAAIN